MLPEKTDNNSDIEFLKKMCLYCINNYQIMNSSRMISSLIYQCGRILEMDLAAVEGILYVEINGYKRQYAHCFNVYRSNIIDASIYQFAMIYKNVEHRFPLYISANLPDYIEYKVMHEIKYETQFKFQPELLNKIIDEAAHADNLSENRFSLIEDSSKKNLFTLIIK